METWICRLYSSRKRDKCGMVLRLRDHPKCSVALATQSRNGGQAEFGHFSVTYTVLKPESLWNLEHFSRMEGSGHGLQMMGTPWRRGADNTSVL